MDSISLFCQFSLEEWLGNYLNEELIGISMDAADHQFQSVTVGLTNMTPVIQDVFCFGKKAAELTFFYKDKENQTLGAHCLNQTQNLLTLVLQKNNEHKALKNHCLLYTSPSPRDATLSRMPSSA